MCEGGSLDISGGVNINYCLFFSIDEKNEKSTTARALWL